MAANGFTYVIRTNLPPEAVSRIGMAIFALWVDFAMGNGTLNGKRLVHPTGRYAASIEYKQMGAASVAIVANEDAAPEAGILESGHGSVDLKTKLEHGRPYPMHRALGSDIPSGGAKAGYVPGASLKPTMWAEVRKRSGSGFASIGPNSAPGSWIIPPMPAYAPAMALASIARSMAGQS